MPIRSVSYPLYIYLADDQYVQCFNHDVRSSILKFDSRFCCILVCVRLSVRLSQESCVNMFLSQGCVDACLIKKKSSERYKVGEKT